MWTPRSPVSFIHGASRCQAWFLVFCWEWNQELHTVSLELSCGVPGTLRCPLMICAGASSDAQPKEAIRYQPWARVSIWRPGVAQYAVLLAPTLGEHADHPDVCLATFADARLRRVFFVHPGSTALESWCHLAGPAVDILRRGNRLFNGDPAAVR